MNVTVKQLRIFVEVARSLSFAGAAAKLHLSQPAISLAVQNLEQSIGGKLFARSTRTLELTPEGEQFFPVAQRLLGDWAEALGDVNNLFTMQRGKLNLAVMPAFGANVLPDLIARYHQAYPEINLVIDNIVMEQAIEAVRKQRYELAVTFEGGQLEGVEFLPLFSDRFLAIYPQGLAKQLDQENLHEDWSALFKLPMVMMDRDSTVRQWLDRQFAQQQVMPKIVAEVNQLESLGRMVAAGVGVGIVPAICKEQMGQLDVVMQELNPDLLSRRVGIVRRVKAPLSSAAQHMFNMLVETYQGEVLSE